MNDTLNNFNRGEYNIPVKEMTLTQLNSHKKDCLDDLVEQAGGVTHLACMLTLHPMTIRGWLDRGQISKKGATLVEEHLTLGKYFKAKDLRPDI